MRSHYLYYITILFALLTTSCNQWLDIKPKNSIQEDELFSNERGFKDVLTGFYIQMGASELYGEYLTFNKIERLAKRYDYPEERDKDTYNFEQQQGSHDNIYLKSYKIIANINKLLVNLENRREVLTTDHYYEIIKGEALGLRAFLHFDLLRLFGPIYSADSTASSISYRTSISKYATPRLPANQVMDSILMDLNHAKALLENHDPQLFEANEDDINQDPFLRLRQLRMNVQAVKAIMARVYNWRGDTESKKMACRYAEEVIASNKFYLASNLAFNPIAFSEHIFSLHVYQLNKRTEKLFDILDDGTKNLALQGNHYNTIYENPNDLRRKLFRFGSADTRISTKYDQKVYSSEYEGKELIPLIRLSEMYLILAECYNDKQSSIQAINTLQSIRQANQTYVADTWDEISYATILAPDNAKSNRTNEIMKEYMREFYAEGQLYYFYKRHAYSAIYPTTKMKRHYYRFSLPDNEIIFGDNN